MEKIFFYYKIHKIIGFFENFFYMKIHISVTNDLVTDQRVNKIALSLQKMGFEVFLIGRLLKKSLPLNRPYSCKRMSLFFKKGFLFYAEYNLRLFFYLMFQKTDILLANDLDTLLANFLVSKIKNKKIVYDSHEYFTELPEVFNRKFVRKTWLFIEKLILPRIKNSYTVCESIANEYKKKYNINMKVIRNLPNKNYNNEISHETKNKISEIKQFSKNKNIIIYQGSINIGRGLEEAIKAMKYIDNSILLIIGKGTIYDDLIKLRSKLFLKDKIFFTGILNFEQLHHFTKIAKIGICIEKNIGMNYYFALPNKLFDYQKAGVPVLSSKLPEIYKIVKTYKVGISIENHEVKHIAEKINFMLNNKKKLEIWKKNSLCASKKLNWENEEKILKEIFNSIS
ncbi:MAG: hypothetical protein B6I24_09145 [Bacteroidetes bacterium 4572_128]|nr:MAG: hypothetical protein B6I24_09145 [Bacteroidetes bacterium 4572_128]